MDLQRFDLYLECGLDSMDLEENLGKSCLRGNKSLLQKGEEMEV